MRKTFRAYHRSVTPDGIHTFIASSEGVKRDGLDIRMDGIKYDNYMRNPVVLWAHDYRGQRLPIGRVEALELDGNGKKMRAHVQFDMADPFAAEVDRKYRDRYLSAVSVGWDTVEQEGNIITKAELLDLSAVPVPGDADALIERQRAYYAEELAALTSESGDGAGVVEPPSGPESSSPAPHNAPPPSTNEDFIEEMIEMRGETYEQYRAERLANPEFRELYEQKLAEINEIRGAIPPHTTSKQDETVGWDGPGQVAKADATKATLRQMHAWVDPDADPDTKRAYKLPHHTATGEVNWRGTAAAMARLFQTGTQIPDSDRKGVWTHLARHYSQFGKEPPEYRTAQELDGLPVSLIDGMLPNGEQRILRETVAGEIGAAVDVLKTAIAEYEACNGDTENREPAPDLQEIPGDLAAILDVLPEVPEKETENE